MVSSIGKKECHVCNKKFDPEEGNGLKERVKIPGYTGTHERWFCSKSHLRKWKDFVKEWEKKNHKITESNSGPTCVNCMR